MKAAIYARYSTDKQSESSLADQVRVCERLAERHGFTVVARYQDAALSGGTVHRPGYQAMLAAARRGDFAVIVAEDTSRLWRLLAEQAPRLAELADLGVHVVTHDLDTRQESGAIMGAVSGAMAEQYRREIARRTRRGLEGVARAGKSAGGRAYGYVPAAKSASGRLEVEPNQATIVRRIFEEYAAGKAPRSIAAGLNADGIPSPGSTWARTERRAKGWLGSAIAGDPARGSGILNNELYRGVLVWNRSRWVRSARDSGKRRQVLNPRSEWVTHRDEALRIVAEELWERVKARQRERQLRLGAMVKAGQVERKRRPGGGRGPRYPFTGLLKCGECASSFTAVNRHYLACAGYVYGRACGNSLHIRRELAAAEALDGIREYLRDPVFATEAIRRAERLYEQRQAAPQVDRERLAKLRAEVSNLTEAIAGGLLRQSPALARRLAEAEAELERLEELAARPVPVVRIAPRLARRFEPVRRELDRALGSADPERCREALLDILPREGITLTPDPSRSFLILEAEIETPLKLVAGGVSEIMVAGAGFEPATFGL